LANTEERILDKIGKVTLDLTRYPGEDKYCDGDIEDTLLEIAKDRAEVEYQRIIEESASWPILYHLSPLRENIVEWLPIDKSMKVLEVGSGCGAITGALSRKAGSVTCCDLSLKRSKINAYRHMQSDNVTIHVGNFTDVEKDLDKDYDYICLIGVFEYAKGYVDSEDPYGDFLKLLKCHCKAKGNIVIAIENKFGLKYWAGCKEDHLATYFSSLEDYPNGGVVRTFTDRGLIDIAKRCGFRKYKMYYPYPDYKFMTNLYSNNRLPRRGELKNNIRNMDRDRVVLFNEKDVFDNILNEGLFNLYSNSYMLVLGPEPDTDFIRYSNDRMSKYSICTEMVKTDETNSLSIRKRALSVEAADHLKNMAAAGEKLSKRYEGSKLEINKCKLSEDGMSLDLEYVPGTSLEEMLDECLAKNDIDGFVELYKEYLERISYGEENAEITDLDLIFSNILIDGDRWTVIDYEWTVNEARPTREIGFRAIYCYILEDQKRDKLSLDLITDLLGVTDSSAADFREDEMAFQKSVTGNHKSLDEIREAIGNKLYTLDDLNEGEEPLPLNMSPQVYEDAGDGFSEEKSQFMDSSSFEIEIPAGRKAVRIDPCSDCCIVAIKELTWNGEQIGKNPLKFRCNGKKIGNDTYAFATKDPGFTISVKGLVQERVNKLRVDMQVTLIDEVTAHRLA